MISVFFLILEKELMVVFVEHDERFLKEVSTRIGRME